MDTQNIVSGEISPNSAGENNIPLLIYSRTSHKKIAHYPNCSYIRRIGRKNRCYFYSLEDAFENGYRICNCCPAIAHRYRKERKAIDSFCKENLINHQLKNGVIHIISRHDCWRIIVNGNKRKLFLYHKNTLSSHRIEAPGIILGFHAQDFHSSTILGYLQYIADHDRYRDKHICTDAKPSRTNSQEKPAIIKGTKRYRKEQKRKKKRKRRAEIIRVIALIDELSAMSG